MTPEPHPLDLLGLVDDELSPDERRRLGAHLAGCADCRRQREDLGPALAALRALPAPAGPAPGLAAEVRARLAADRDAGRAAPASRPRGWRRLPRAPLALAASLLVAVAAGLLVRQGPPRPVQPARAPLLRDSQDARPGGAQVPRPGGPGRAEERQVPAAPAPSGTAGGGGVELFEAAVPPAPVRFAVPSPPPDLRTRLEAAAREAGGRADPPATDQDGALRIVVPPERYDALVAALRSLGAAPIASESPGIAAGPERRSDTAAAGSAARDAAPPAAAPPAAPPPFRFTVAAEPPS